MRAWGQDVWKAEKDKERANKVAQQARRAAALTAELAAQFEKKTATVCNQPPGPGELAGHIEAPNMEAGGSHTQATMMLDQWATYKCLLARRAQMVEVAKVIPHEREVRPGGEGSSVRERAKRFEKVWGAKHMTSVEGPRTFHGERQKESPVSDVERDTCVSTDPTLSQENKKRKFPTKADFKLRAPTLIGSTSWSYHHLKERPTT